MRWRKAVELLKLCNTPASIISPFPLLAISLFLISRNSYISDLPILFAGIGISLLSNSGSNLWNHCNDVKEDTAQGKKTVLTQNILMQKTAVFIAILLYAFSLLFVFYLSMKLDRPIYIFFSIWVLATWWYSDNLILKNLIGFRLKDNYIGEFITYSTAWPMYILSIWLIYSDLNIKGVLISAAFFFFSIAGVMLKDLKDIAGDRKAGLKTFGVVYLPSELIRYSCHVMVLYFIVMLNPLTLDFFGKGILIVMLPFIYFLKNTFVHMSRKNWILDTGDLKALKGIGYSFYMSVIFLGLSALI